MGGGGSKPPANTTTTTLPPPFMVPYIRQLLGEASHLYQNNPMQYFPGSTVADRNPWETQAMQSMGNTANQIRGALPALAQAQQYGLTGAMDVQNNPYLQGAISGAINPVRWQLQDEVLPGLASGAGAAGQTGSTRQGIAEGLATSRFTQQALDTAARMGSDAYNQGQETFVRSLALAPNLAQMAMMPGQIESGIGQAQRDYEQSLIDAAVDRFNFGQMEPYQRLGLFQDFLSGSFGGQSTTSGGGGAKPSTGQRAAGAAAAGLGTYAALAGSATPALAAAAPWAAAGMALLSFL